MSSELQQRRFFLKGAAEVVVDTFADARLHDVEALAEELEHDLQNDRRGSCKLGGRSSGRRPGEIKRRGRVFFLSDSHFTRLPQNPGVWGKRPSLFPFRWLKGLLGGPFGVGSLLGSLYMIGP